MDKKFISLWLIIGIVMGFLAILFFSLIYLNNNVLCDLDCRGRNEVVLALILLSLVGMFVGSLTYYFISGKYEQKIGKMHKNMKVLYRLFDPDQKLIFQNILDNNGQITQSKLVKETKLSRVKISRSLKKLGEKGIIEKQKSGMTNKIKLTTEISKLFFE